MYMAGIMPMWSTSLHTEGSGRLIKCPFAGCSVVAGVVVWGLAVMIRGARAV